MPLSMQPLPYAMNALAPVISEETLSYHYGKHYATYVKNTNDLIKGTDRENLNLKQLIFTAAADTLDTALFNNASQVYNHEFFWNSLTNDTSKTTPTPKLMSLIEADFGSYESFKEAFKKAALGQFGSGWAWLIFQDGHLKIITTSNAATPLTNPAATPLLTIDVWEHAYYLDHQNRRADFVQGILDHLLNWETALKRYQEK